MDGVADLHAALIRLKSRFDSVSTDSSQRGKELIETRGPWKAEIAGATPASPTHQSVGKRLAACFGNRTSSGFDSYHSDLKNHNVLCRHQDLVREEA